MPTENEMKTNAFKVRLDVLEELKGLLAQVSVSIRGKDLAKNVYKTQLLSSVSDNYNLRKYIYKLLTVKFNTKCLEMFL